MVKDSAEPHIPAFLLKACSLPQPEPERPTAALLLAMAAVSREAAATAVAPPPPARRPDWAAILSVGIVWLVLVTAAVIYQASHLHNLPMGKAWLLVGPDERGGGLVGWVLRSADPESGPLTRLGMTAVLRLRRDFRLSAALSLVLLAVMGAGMVAAAARTRGRVIITDALFPLLFLNPGATRVLSSGWQLTEAVTTGLICLVFAGLLPGRHRSAPGDSRMVNVGLLLLALSGGPGPLIAATMACWALATAWRHRRLADSSRTGRGPGLAVPTAVVVLALVAIEWRLTGAALVPGPFRWADGLAWIGLAFGPVDPRAASVTAIGILAIVATTVVVSVRRGETPQWGVLLVAVTAAAALIGAASGLPESGATTLSAAAAVAAVYLYWSLSGPQIARRRAQLGLAGVAVLLLPANITQRTRSANEYKFGMTQVLGDLYRLDPPSVPEFASQHRLFLAPELDSTDFGARVERLRRRHAVISRLAADSTAAPRPPEVALWPDGVPGSTVQLSYTAPGAAEVALGWGINGWNALPAERRPPGTTVWTSMVTPMHRSGNRFTVTVTVPVKASIEYGFVISKVETGAAIESIWDGDYTTFAGAGLVDRAASPDVLGRFEPLPDSMATGTFSLHLPEAGEVELVWAAKGQPGPVARTWVQGTFEEGNALVTPAVRRGDDFSVGIRAPVGTSLTYRFRPTRSRRGNPVPAAWDSSASHQAVLDQDRWSSHATNVIVDDRAPTSPIAALGGLALCLLAAALARIVRGAAPGVVVATLQP